MKLGLLVERLMEIQITKPEFNDKEVGITHNGTDYMIFDIDIFDQPDADDEEYGVCITVGDAV